MKNITFQTLLLIALGILSQEVSAADWATGVYPELARGYRYAPATASTGRWFSGWSRPSMPSMPSMSSVTEKLPSMPSFNRPSMPSLGSVTEKLPSKEAIMSYAPTSATPGKIWSGIRGGASSLYGQLPTKERLVEGARALPGQAWSGMKATPGVMQTGLATYAGRPVISGASAAGSGVGSAGAWLGSKLGSAWGSYAPESVKQYAGQAGKYVGENVWAPTAKAFSENVWTPTASYLSQTSAANLLSKMTEEQKQAAVGLAAVIAAGLAAKKGYDVWRGPSAYSQFTISMNEAIAPKLIEYAYVPINESALDILKQINGYRDLINGEVDAGALSQSEASSLVTNLMRMKVQLGLITDINNDITALNKAYTWEKATDLYNRIIGRSPMLTPEQKKILQEKVQFIFDANKPIE